MSPTQCRSTKPKHSQTVCCAVVCGAPVAARPARPACIPSGPNFILDAVMKYTASAQTPETSRAATQAGRAALLVFCYLWPSDQKPTLNPDLPTGVDSVPDDHGYVPHGNTHLHKVLSAQATAEHASPARATFFIGACPIQAALSCLSPPCPSGTGDPSQLANLGSRVIAPTDKMSSLAKSVPHTPSITASMMYRW